MVKRPSPISGFPEFLPQQQIALSRAVGQISEIYESFGYVPIETPAVERVEYLLAKGIADKEVYGIKRLQDVSKLADEPDLALRFDLTVPLARYVAQHYGELRFPFKRYQIQPVWRGERAQAGRYRQFVQCDIDTIGDGSLSLSYDAEVPAIIFQLFRRLAFGKFTLRINNRKVLSGLLNGIGVEDARAQKRSMDLIDDLEKTGPDSVIEKFESELSVSKASAETLLEFFALSAESGDKLAAAANFASDPLFEEGLRDLDTVLSEARMCVPDKYETGPLVSVESSRDDFEKHVEIDFSIARGLDYYTGTVYETRFDRYPEIGSICSGGRYDNLASSFTTRKLPGVGISIGLTRLFARLFDAGLVTANRSTTAPVLVTCQDRDLMPFYQEAANRLRQEGVAVEVYLEDKSLKAQLRYANGRGFPLVVIAGRDEAEKDVVRLKSMAFDQEQVVNLSQLGPVVRSQVPPDWD